MFGFKRYIKILQIRNCAQHVASRKGRSTRNGWYFDDGRMKMTDQYETIIIYRAKKRDKMVYLFCKERGEIYCRRGEWQMYLLLHFDNLKTRH